VELAEEEDENGAADTLDAEKDEKTSVLDQEFHFPIRGKRCKTDLAT